jgi:tetratricopeptide (TPR) repeat protein
VAEHGSSGRHGGVHADRNIKVTGNDNRIAGHNIVDADVYIEHVETAVFQQADARARLALLPPDVAEFTGRSGEVAELAAALRATDGPAVVVSAVAGKPGVGKSALAIHVAHLLTEYFPDGQVYVNLRGADEQPLSPETALTELLQVLGVPGDRHPPSLDAKATVWRQQLASRRVLLVIDNASSEAQVRPLLPGSRTCAVIVTSRTVLAALGSRTWLLNTMDADEALDLLALLAGSERIAAEPLAARAVVAACGGLPLALRIAGARLMARPDWQVAHLARRLTDERRRLAELGWGDLDVRASFQLSYQALKAEPARLFRLLGLLPALDFHPWVTGALLNVGVEAAEDVVDGLVVAQLVEPASNSNRFRLHDLLRLFAREQLGHDSSLDVAAAVGRLLWVAIATAQKAEVAIETAALRREQDQGEQVGARVASAWLEAERGTLVALVELANEWGHWPAAWNLSELLTEFLSRRGYRVDLERVHRLAVQAARQLGHIEAEARGLNNLGMDLVHLGHWEQAVEYLQQALTIWRQIGDRHGEAAALTNLGVALGSQGHWALAADRHRQALAIWQGLGDRRGQAQTLNGLGDVLVRQGHWPEAADLHEQALKIQREFGDRHGEGQTLNSLANVLVLRSDWKQAADHYQQSLAIKRELGDRPGQAQTLSNLGAVFARQHQNDQAVTHFRQGLAIAREANDRHLQGQILSSLGNLLHRQGNWQEASDHYRQALTIQQQLGDRHGQAQALVNLGNLLAQQGQSEQAEDAYQRALKILRALGDRYSQAQALTNLGILFAHQTQPEQAEDAYRQALTIHHQLGSRHGEAQVLTNSEASLPYKVNGR